MRSICLWERREADGGVFGGAALAAVEGGVCGTGGEPGVCGAGDVAEAVDEDAYELSLNGVNDDDWTGERLLVRACLAGTDGSTASSGVSTRVSTNRSILQ